MMNRMMKAEAVFEAQAAIEVYVILHAVKDKSGGFINMDCINLEL